MALRVRVNPASMTTIQVLLGDIEAEPSHIPQGDDIRANWDEGAGRRYQRNGDTDRGLTAKEVLQHEGRQGGAEHQADADIDQQDEADAEPARIVGNETAR